MKPSSSSPRSLSLPCCSSSLGAGSVTWRTKAPSTARPRTTEPRTAGPGSLTWRRDLFGSRPRAGQLGHDLQQTVGVDGFAASRVNLEVGVGGSTLGVPTRSEEHTSELQSLMRISYAVFCLKKKKHTKKKSPT